MKTSRIGLLVLALTLIPVLGACAPEPEPPTQSPEIEITAPMDGTAIEPGMVTVMIEVTGFGIVDRLGEDPVRGEGHVHYYMDVTPPTAPDEPAVTEEGTYAVSPGTSYMWEDVTPGSHTFAVQLVNNDHTPLDPPVTDEVEVTVAAANGDGEGDGQTTLTLIADGLAFDTDTITVEAGARVTMTFENHDTVDHNFALYETSAADVSIFVGEIIGMGSTTYEFTAPSEPGTYFFRCDVHPTTMTGDFVVT